MSLGIKILKTKESGGEESILRITHRYVLDATRRIRRDHTDYILSEKIPTDNYVLHDHLCDYQQDVNIFNQESKTKTV